MLLWLDVGNMKIGQCSRKACMPETLLYLQKGLAILKEMCCSRMSQSMHRNRTIVACLHQGILQNGTDISGLDGLRIHSSSMCLEHEVVTGKYLLEDEQQA